jgi:hypothetical protein
MTLVIVGLCVAYVVACVGFMWNAVPKITHMEEPGRNPEQWEEIPGLSGYWHRPSYSEDEWDDLVEEGLSRWAERAAEEHAARVAAMDPADVELAWALHARAGELDPRERPRYLSVTRQEFEAWEQFLAPWGRFVDAALAREGKPNLFCRGIPIVCDE